MVISITFYTVFAIFDVLHSFVVDLHRVSKKVAHVLLSISSLNIDRFS